MSAQDICKAIKKAMDDDQASLLIFSPDQREERAGEADVIKRYYMTYYKHFDVEHTMYFEQQDSDMHNFRDPYKPHIVGWPPTPTTLMSDADHTVHTYDELKARHDARCAYIATHTSNELVWEVVGSYKERDSHVYLIPHEIKAINYGHDGELAVAWYRYVLDDSGSTTRKRQCIAYTAQEIVTTGYAQGQDVDMLGVEYSQPDSQPDSDTEADRAPISPREQARQKEWAYYEQPLRDRMNPEQEGELEGPEQKPYERVVVGRLVKERDEAASPVFRTLYDVVYNGVLQGTAVLKAQLVLELKEASHKRASIETELKTLCDSYLFECNIDMRLTQVHYYEEHAQYGKAKLAFVHVAVEIEQLPKTDHVRHNGYYVKQCDLDVWLSTRLLDFEVVPKTVNAPDE